MDPNQNPQNQSPDQLPPPYGTPPYGSYDAGSTNPSPTGSAIVSPMTPADSGKANKTGNSSNKKNKLILIGAGLTAIMLIVIIAVVALLLLDHKPKKLAVITPPPQLCFIRVAKLYCVDDSGQNPVRYDIPPLPQSARVSQLVANPDQSDFLAVSNTAVSTNDIWILGPKLQQEEQLALPSGVSAQTPTWSRDGKSILLEIDGAQKSRQIERYSIASNTLEQLTTTGYNTQPYETKNGQILYSYSSSQTGNFYPYIMNNDGSNPQLLGNLTSLKIIYGFSYDTATDTIFVFGVNGQGQPSIVYGTTTDFLQGRVVNTLVAPVHPGDNIVYVDKSTVVVQHNDYATILGLSQNTQSTTIHNVGPLIGMLNTDNFQKSAQQTEQKYDRIIGLAGAPPDFGGFMKGVFDTGDAACSINQTALANGDEYQIVIYSVVADGYASVSQGCGQENELDYYYAKNPAGDWTLAFQTQGIPTCVQVNQYNFTAEIIAQCFNPTGRLVDNNPATDTQANS